MSHRFAPLRFVDRVTRGAVKNFESGRGACKKGKCLHESTFNFSRITGACQEVCDFPFQCYTLAPKSEQSALLGIGVGDLMIVHPAEVSCRGDMVKISVGIEYHGAGPKTRKRF